MGLKSETTAHAVSTTSSSASSSDTSLTPLWLGGIIVLALLLRLGAVLALHSWEHPDAMEHAALAGSLLKTGTFSFGDFGYYGPSSVQSPPYPLLLAGLFKIFQSTSAGYFAAMVINALAGAATAGVVYVLARTLGGSRTVALTAALLVAIWPTQIYDTTVAQAISLITLGAVAIVTLFYRAVRTGRLTPWIGFSVIGCLAALTEPVLLPLMAFSGLLIFLYRSLKLSTRVRNAAILLGCAIVIIGPWTLRNRLVHGKWIPIKSTFWVNVWKGNNPHATGTDRLAMLPSQRREYWAGMLRWTDRQARQTDIEHQYAILTPQQLSQLHDQPEAVREDLFKAWTTTWIKSHPREYLGLCVERLEKTLWIDWDNPKSYKLIYVVSRVILLLLAACGLVMAIIRRWSLTYPALLVGSCLLTYTLTITAARFMLPLEPFFLCLGALCIVTAIQWIFGRGGHLGDSLPHPESSAAS